MSRLENTQSIKEDIYETLVEGKINSDMFWLIMKKSSNYKNKYILKFKSDKKFRNFVINESKKYLEKDLDGFIEIANVFRFSRADIEKFKPLILKTIIKYLKDLRIENENHNVSEIVKLVKRFNLQSELLPYLLKYMKELLYKKDTEKAHMIIAKFGIDLNKIRPIVLKTFEYFINDRKLSDAENISISFNLKENDTKNYKKVALQYLEDKLPSSNATEVVYCMKTIKAFNIKQNELYKYKPGVLKVVKYLLKNEWNESALNVILTYGVTKDDLLKITKK